MPLQNRVDPYGKLNAVEARGAWLGNRGVLHNSYKSIVRQWQLKRWITCTLTFKDRHREVFTPSHYTELFFLDEATAFAGGHRPCAECRRERYNAFKSAWLSLLPGRTNISAVEMDELLHSERLLPTGGKKTFQSSLSNLPDGTIVECSNRPLLIWNNRLLSWSFSGYSLVETGHAEVVTVLTPESIVKIFQKGYVPEVHQSASSEI